MREKGRERGTGTGGKGRVEEETISSEGEKTIVLAEHVCILMDKQWTVILHT